MAIDSLNEQNPNDVYRDLMKQLTDYLNEKYEEINLLNEKIRWREKSNVRYNLVATFINTAGLLLGMVANIVGREKGKTKEKLHSKKLKSKN